MDEMNFVIVNTNTNTRKMENGYRSSEFCVLQLCVSDQVRRSRESPHRGSGRVQGGDFLPLIRQIV